MPDQIKHDAVTCAHYLRNRTGSGADQILRISEPNVGAMRQAGNLQKIGKVLRFGIHQHALDKARAHLRQAERAEPISSGVTPSGAQDKNSS